MISRSEERNVAMNLRLLLLICVLGTAAFLVGCGGRADKPISTFRLPPLGKDVPNQPLNPVAASSETPAFAKFDPLKVVTTESGVKYEDLKVGTGPVAKSGDELEMHYTGWQTDGTKFDSSHNRGNPIQFRVDRSDLIKGWHIGAKGMAVGGKRKILIPSELAYGSAGRPPVIPHDADLIFELELVKITPE